MNDNDPAFPIKIRDVQKIADRLGQPIAEVCIEQGFHPGMTYRQWLAGQALNGLCANSYLRKTTHAAELSPEIANLAVQYAEEVIDRFSYIERKYREEGKA